MDQRFRARRRGKFIFFIPLMIAFAFILGAVVMLLWNAILPGLLGVKIIGYWQALGLLVLCKILFGGFGPGGGRPDHRQHHMMRERLQNMSEEEREKFRAEWRRRW